MAGSSRGSDVEMGGTLKSAVVKDEEVVEHEEKEEGIGMSQSREQGQKKMTIEELQIHLQRELVEENRILSRAEAIQQERARSRLPAAAEPKRAKSHWDHVLEEMSWLAKEFQKERKWKIQNAKRLAGAAQRSNMDLESRVVLREKEEEKARRRRANWIAREVMNLWTKAQKVVAFKVRNEVDARKKEVLDKQLDALLGQTQKYSSLLAERLRGDEAEKVKAASRSYPTIESSMEIREEPASLLNEREGRASQQRESGDRLVPAASGTLNSFEEEDGMDYRSGEDDDADDEATLEEEERLALAELGTDLKREQMDETRGLEEDADLPLEDLLAKYGYVVREEKADLPIVLPSQKTSELSALVSGDAPFKSTLAQEFESLPENGEDAPGNDADEYKSDEDDDADDEATLEEEERLAAAENGENLDRVQAQETAGLQADADLPLEQLLERYGYVSNQGKIDTIEDKENVGMEGTLEAMVAAQPTGYTFETAKVQTPVPFLLKGKLREYQHIGLDWLVTLYQKHLNGILADEMGLGKTIQTIALLSWLACERGDWGPHLIVVPTSVMLNWEMEFKRWCPAFKLLTYYGTPKERAAKRQGWSKPNAFHVCITSYTLVLQDARMFRRKKWKYLILDEAHMIKNWKSQRWQTLLNFNSKRRLLITGTPLQNDLMELWSLMHFLMPQVFGSHAQFKDWFSNPLTGMVEGSAEYNKAIIQRLHSVLRPFLLRRLKKDVEKQLPAKHEHVIRCKLSKRQRQLYEEYVSQTETRNALASGNFLGIMNCLMQLRKVCNHPDLFEGRPIISAFDMDPIQLHVPVLVLKDAIDLGAEDLKVLKLSYAACALSWEQDTQQLMEKAARFEQDMTSMDDDLAMILGNSPVSLLGSLGRTPSAKSLSVVSNFIQDLANKRKEWRKQRSKSIGKLSIFRSNQKPPLFGESIVRCTKVEILRAQNAHSYFQKGIDIPSSLIQAVKLPEQRALDLDAVMKAFVFAIPKARTTHPELVSSVANNVPITDTIVGSKYLWEKYTKSTTLLHIPKIRSQVFFPDKRLIQYDCGKLQELAALLNKLKSGGHRVLIFTQMSKMLDVLESFLNIHGHTYVRLDGATKPETRQILMQRFNTDPKIFCFILSTRSGGVGMNLTGADTVIFYDSDWNPAMDAQAQDRCHRIGQTREVHIYRLISEHTIEENILRKSDQKRQLDFLAIQSGGFTTDILHGSLMNESFYTKDVKDKDEDESLKAAMRAAEDEGDAAAAAAAEKETAAEMEEFTLEGTLAPSSSAPSEDRSNKEEGESSEGTMRPTQASTPQLGEDDDIMEEVVKLARNESGNDPIEALNKALKPIERYAVRFLEDYSQKFDKDVLTAQMEAVYKVEQFDIDAIEAAEVQREADIDEDEEANLVTDWDQNAATVAYESQLKAAEEEEKKRLQAEAEWLEQQLVLQPQGPQIPSKRGKVGRPKRSVIQQKETESKSTAAEELLKMEQQRVINQQQVKGYYVPWDLHEDLVLVSVIYKMIGAGEDREDLIWSTASGALAAGCAATSVADSELAVRKGRLRTKERCKHRYHQLRCSQGLSLLISSRNTVQARASFHEVVKKPFNNLLQILNCAEEGPSEYRKALSTLLKGMQVADDTQFASIMLVEMSRMRISSLKKNDDLFDSNWDSDSPIIEEVKNMASVVRSRCRTETAHFIDSKLPSVIEASRLDAGRFLDSNKRQRINTPQPVTGTSHYEQIAQVSGPQSMASQTNADQTRSSINQNIFAALQAHMRMIAARQTAVPQGQTPAAIDPRVLMMLSLAQQRAVASHPSDASLEMPQQPVGENQRQQANQQGGSSGSLAAHILDATMLPSHPNVDEK
eukprot:jgi/Picsp_1/3673/NSC_06510-R1_swr1 complex snf2 family dna-dependent atpase